MKTPDREKRINRLLDLVYIWLFFWGLGNFVEWLHWYNGL